MPTPSARWNRRNALGGLGALGIVPTLSLAGPIRGEAELQTLFEEVKAGL